MISFTPAGLDSQSEAARHTDLRVDWVDWVDCYTEIICSCSKNTIYTLSSDSRPHLLSVCLSVYPSAAIGRRKTGRFLCQ